MSNDPRGEYSGAELQALSAAVNYHRWIVDEFKPYLGETVVEVGAGIGSVSKLLLESPIKRLFAFEPSTREFTELAVTLRNEPRAVLNNEPFSYGAVPDGVDSIAYINVLEHIEDDRLELKNAFQSLRPNGHLLVFVPALDWLFSDFDRHVGHRRRYSKTRLCDLVEEVGFEVTKVRNFDIAGILPWYVNFVLLKGRPDRRSVMLYDKIAVPPMRLLERLVPPPIGKNVLLAARKPIGHTRR
jgi:SAM-dependent methyltransferase